MCVPPQANASAPLRLVALRLLANCFRHDEAARTLLLRYEEVRAVECAPSVSVALLLVCAWMRVGVCVRARGAWACTVLLVRSAVYMRRFSALLSHCDTARGGSDLPACRVALRAGCDRV